MNKLLKISLLLAVTIPIFLSSVENAFAGPPTAIRNNPGFTDNLLEDPLMGGQLPGDQGTDDGSAFASIGFAVNFFGSVFNDLFVNNNGNITFDSAFSDFDPQDIDFTTSDRRIIAPFFADIDTRQFGGLSPADVVTYGQSTVNGRPAFGVNWFNSFCFGATTLNPLNTFQLVLIDRSDVNPGDFDIEFNYDEVLWDTAPSAFVSGSSPIDSDTCIETVDEGRSAKIGFADGTGNPDSNPPTQATNFFELPGSGVSQAFLDSGPAGTSLIQNSLNSIQQGRYIIPVRDGIPFNEVEPMIGGTTIPIDSISILLAGAQSVTWMIPVSLSVLGITLFLIKGRIH